MKRITVPLCRLLENVAILLLALLCVDVFIGVVDRYLLKTGMAWTEEMARYLLIWLSLLSAAVATHRSTHFRIAILVDLLSARVRRVVLLAMNALALVVLALMLKWGADITAFMTIQKSAAMELPMNWIYLSLPVSTAAMILFLIDETVDIARSKAETAK